jgi:hypothetical protein
VRYDEDECYEEKKAELLVRKKNKKMKTKTRSPIARYSQAVRFLR